MPTFNGKAVYENNETDRCRGVLREGLQYLCRHKPHNYEHFLEEVMQFYEEIGRTDDAEKYLMQICSLHGQNDPTSKSYMHYLSKMAGFYEKIGKTKTAEEYHLNACRAGIANEPQSYRYARLLTEEGIL